MEGDEEEGLVKVTARLATALDVGRDNDARLAEGQVGMGDDILPVEAVKGRPPLALVYE